MEAKSEIIDKCLLNIHKDTTVRLSFRTGDFLIHSRIEDIFTNKLSIIDIWELKDKQSAILTNRVEDLPNWFLLHPSEVRNLLAYKMLDKFNRGEYPSEPIDGPNIWRARAGDRIIWIGNRRPDIESVDGILKIFNFRECALIIGEPGDSMTDLIGFGGISENEDTKVKMEQVRNAISIIKEMGCPQSISVDWSLG